MEALAEHRRGPGDTADTLWHDTQPHHGAAQDAMGGRPGRADGTAHAATHATAQLDGHLSIPWAVDPDPDGDGDAAAGASPDGFHEPLGGLQMRELVSPELFEHLFGPPA